MDHISRALERAQSEQRSISSWVRPSSVETRIVAPNLKPTNSVVLRESHLRARHVLCGRGKEDQAVSDRYRLLRTRLLQVLKSQEHNSVGITSPGPKDGKTLTSINLSISIAREGSYKVVLVDADLRKPSVADDLGIQAEKGLIDYLSSPDVEFADILMQTSIDNLFVVPGRHEHFTRAVPELLSSDRMRDLVTQYRGQEHCIVIIDLPPVHLGDDVVALAPYLDGILMVVREGGTPINALKESVDLLKDYAILGTVLNDSSERKQNFDGYYYGGATERA